jgi:hypothetical protein
LAALHAITITRVSIASSNQSWMTYGSSSHPKRNIRHCAAEIGIGVASDAAIVPGIDATPLPTGAQNYSVYVAGIGAGSKDAEAANALMTFLTSSAIKQALNAKGFEAN